MILTRITIYSDGNGGCIEETQGLYEPNTKYRRAVPCPDSFKEDSEPKGIAVDDFGDPIVVTEKELTSNNLNDEETYEPPKRKKAKKKVRRPRPH